MTKFYVVHNTLKLYGTFPTNMSVTDALKLSIVKWETIRVCDEWVNDNGTETCALCNLFYTNFCAGCPVAEFTGEPLCHESPYMNYSRTRFNHADRKNVAAAEVAFLKQILTKLEGDNRESLTKAKELLERAEKHDDTLTPLGPQSLITLATAHALVALVEELKDWHTTIKQIGPPIEIVSGMRDDLGIAF